MLVSAIFRGKNGSLGYEVDKEYVLHITYKNSRIIICKDRAGECEYSNIITFLQNWTNIKEVTEDIFEGSEKYLFKKIYHGNDSFIDGGKFYEWIMSASGVKRIHTETSGNFDNYSIYTFENAVIKYDESGSWKDGAPVSVKIECEDVELFKQICEKLEKNFPRLTS